MPLVDGALRNLRRREYERWKHVRDPRFNFRIIRCAITATGNSSGLQGASSAATITAAITATTPGNYLIMTGSRWANFANTVSVSDDQGNGWTVDNQNNAKNPTAFIASAKITGAGGTVNVTASLGGVVTAYWRVCVIEFSGFATSSWADQQGSNAHAAGAVSEQVTAGGANTLADTLSVVVISNDSGTANSHTSNPPSGYTSIAYEPDCNTAVGHQSSYKIETSIVTSTATWTFDTTTADGTSSLIQTYKGTSGGGASQVPYMPYAVQPTMAQ